MNKWSTCLTGIHYLVLTRTLFCVFWADRTLYLMCCYLQGKEEKPRIIRRTVARYMMFGLILICRSISVAVMKRFPTLDHIVEAGNPFQKTIHNSHGCRRFYFSWSFS